jgi:UbiD family decarboxylase
MAYRDIREFSSVLEKKGKLRRIQKGVDPTWELACLARWMFQAFPDKDRFGMFFEKIKGFDIPVMTGVIGASRETYAIALQTEPEEINGRWSQALLHPVSPRIVESAPCQEIVELGDYIDVQRIPIPVWTPGKDAAPYISTVAVSRDDDTGIQNAAFYRSMVKNSRHLAVNLAPGRHGRLCYDSYVKKGKAAPFAWVIGPEPVVYLAGVANVPYGTDELAIAGGLKGEPLEVVRAKTVDLLVPAHAEFIIEGELQPGEFGQEGPFGEFAGYMGPAEQKPLARITAITHRRDPIYYGFISQMPPSESTVVQSISNAGLILKMLRHDLGHRTIRDVHIDLTFGGMLAHGIVSMKPMYPGHAKQVGRLVASMTLLKRVTVVDEDIDIRDPFHIDWAMNSRFSPRGDTIIIDDVFTPANMDPTVRVLGGKLEAGSKLVIDATEKGKPGDISLPTREHMIKALEVWRDLDLPGLEVPKRTQLMLGYEPK